MKQQEKKELMKRFGIINVSGGKYGEGFFDCLEGVIKKDINIFKFIL